MSANEANCQFKILSRSFLVDFFFVEDIRRLSLHNDIASQNKKKFLSVCKHLFRPDSTERLAYLEPSSVYVFANLRQHERRAQRKSKIAKYQPGSQNISSLILLAFAVPIITQNIFFLLFLDLRTIHNKFGSR
jgi:hypothetical protein